jgi:isoleucyl-tRNA synthetase
VHLCDWPPAGHTNGIILQEMTDVRRIITIGLSVRAEAGIRVRQPLPKIKLHQRYKELPESLQEIIREELNVKEVKFDEHMVEPDKTVLENIEEHGLPQTFHVELDTTITPELKREGLARELIRSIQNARKNAGLNVDDRINLNIESGSKEVQEAFTQFKDEIFHETLATGELGAEAGHSEEVKLDGQPVQIRISKN